LVQEYEASGLSRKAFCAGRGLSVHTLDAYRRRVRKILVGDDVHRGELLPVELVGSGAKIGRPDKEAKPYGLTVVLANGRQIEIGPGFDAWVLEQIVAVLERA
jgi:hypothetical protein